MKTYKGKDVVYAGILFSEESQTLLKEMANAFLGKSLPGIVSTNKVECQHLTLGFGDDVLDEHLTIVGMPVTSLSPYRILLDDTGCGLFFEKRVLRDRGIPWIGVKDANPHVTLYHNRGVPPQYIGTMGERNHSVIIADATRSLNGTVGVFTTDGLWVTK